MTLEEIEAGPNTDMSTMDTSMGGVASPSRQKPRVHPAVDAPVCSACLKMELQFFDPNCPGCQENLTKDSTTVPEIFAILRQWTPQTQQNLEMLVNEALRRGCHVDDRDALTDMTLLQLACRAGASGVGHVQEACAMVERLIERGADVYIRSRWTNMAALHYATYFDVAPVITILLKASKAIDVDSPCSEFDDGAPLHIAAANVALASATVLLETGANPHSRDSLGRTPLDCVPDADAFDPDSEMGSLVSRLRKLLQEAPSVVSDSQVSGSVAGMEARQALKALGLKIGDKVVVGGVKTGILRFCGKTKFAAGTWAGIELEDQAGKNDGVVGGVAYFKCAPKYGIFAPVNKISKPGILRASMSPMRSGSASYGKIDTSHVSSRIDTGLHKGSRLSMPLPLALAELDVGDRVVVAGQRTGVIRFAGDTLFAPGLWFGIELDRAVGKNDGSVGGERYFTCKARHGVFAPPSRVQRFTDSRDSRESLDSISISSEKQRRLSVGSSSSQQSGNSVKRSPSMRAYSKSALGSINESPSSTRPKSSGAAGMRRTLSASGGEFRLVEGMSVFCNNEIGVVRYIGPVDFADGTWLGVELRSPRGKNDGSVQGRRYFQCRPNHGLVVRPAKVTVRGISGARLLGQDKGGERPAAGASPGTKGGGHASTQA